MGFAGNYLSRYAVKLPEIEFIPGVNPGQIVVIPAFDEPELIRTLNALLACKPAKKHTEIITVINYPENVPEDIKSSGRFLYDQVLAFARENNSPSVSFLPVFLPDMPEKQAGVGLARKTGMDLAVSHFEITGKPEGIIVSFDADSVCDENYLVTIEDHFNSHPESPGASIYYEHPVSGTDFPPKVYSFVEKYELHLRYYVQAQRYAGFPMAFHTVGSAFAVRAGAYCKQGGMNKRKAGEDFYFLEKIFRMGNFTEINTTRVIPSSRPSSRVPFGTGAAVKKFLSNADKNQLTTYDPKAFRDIKKLLDAVPELFIKNTDAIPGVIHNLPDPVSQFLQQHNFPMLLEEMKHHASNESNFLKRFYQWFTGFRMMRFLNDNHPVPYAKIPVEKAAAELLIMLDKKTSPARSTGDLLKKYRALDRGKAS
ncbi:MAG TPA: hypothetical protein VE912_11240 [Bacteroidales bacterium]|nr:hypothetical protein [Bacteroidales bacterium]